MSLPALLESNWPHFPGTSENGKLPYGWAGQQHYFNSVGFDAHFQLYNDIVRWCYDTIQNTKQNAYWTKIGDCIYIQLRKEEDLLMFILKFGDGQ